MIRVSSFFLHHCLEPPCHPIVAMASLMINLCMWAIAKV